MSRLINPLRSAAREAGERFYDDATPCEACGETQRYTVNGACVSCARRKGSQHYHGLDDAGRDRLKRKDRERYRLRRQAAAEAMAAELDAILSGDEA